MTAASAPFSSAFVFPDREGGRICIAIVKKTYEWRGEGLVLAAPVKLEGDPWTPKPPKEWTAGSDFHTGKYATDVVIIGRAHGRDGRPFSSTEVSVTVGDRQKSVRVFGPRFVEWSQGRPRITGPDAVESIELSADNAYGGCDGRAQPRRPRNPLDLLATLGAHPGWYPRNPNGKGYLIFPEPLDERVELPNLEDPRHLLTLENLFCGDPTRWHAQPLPWFLSWSSPSAFPRDWILGSTPPGGLPRDPLEEERRGFVPEPWRERDDPGHAVALSTWVMQEASHGMSFRGLASGAPIAVRGVDPERHELRFEVPPSPRLVLEAEGDIQEVQARLAHIVAEPAERRAVATWWCARELPRAFFPGIHGYIPVALHVDGHVVPYETPEPIYEQLQRAEREGRLAPSARATSDEAVYLETHDLFPGAVSDRTRDQAPRTDVVRVGDVDPVAGRVLLEETDWVFTGSVPLALRRFYSSSLTWRRGSLGRGWTHSLEQAIWEEGGWLIYRTEDGREIGIPLDGGTLALGARAHHPLAGVTITRVSSDAYVAELSTGRHLTFRRIEEPVRTGAAKARLSDVFAEDGTCLKLRYDTRGLLDRLILAGGGSMRFEHDARGRLVRVFVPTSDGKDSALVAAYVVDDGGNLVNARDGLGRSTEYRYRGHLLWQRRAPTGWVQEFEYDEQSPKARCIRERSRIEGNVHTCELAYVAVEDVVSISDALGASFSVQARSPGAIARVRDVFGNEVARTYDNTSGLIARQTTNDGETTFLFDSDYHLAEITGPAEKTIRLDHDGDGRMTSNRDADGHAATFHWDALGRLCAASDRRGASVVYEHAGEGALTSVTTPDGVRIEVERLGDAPLALRTPVGERRATRDALGRVASLWDAGANPTSFRYDAFGRVREVSRDGLALSFTADGEGRVLTCTIGGREVRLGRDSRGRLNEVLEGGLPGLRLHRDAEGRVRMVENEALEYWEVLRDAAGRVIEELGFVGMRFTALRDHRGRIARSLCARSTTRVTRDSTGHPIHLDHSDGSFQRLTWTPGGRLVRAQEGDRSVALQRDGEGRPTIETQDDHWVRSTYDACGRRVAFDSSVGLSVRIARDVLGGPSSLVGSQGEQTLELRFERDACGRERERLLPGGLRLSWERDAMGRVIERSVMFGERQLASLRFAWRGVDRLVRVEESQRGAMDYVHDARGRLVQVRMGMGSVERALDDVGNVYRVRERDDHRYAPGGRVEEAYGIEYRYDGEGRRIEKTTALGEVVRYRWDALGRLLEVALTDTSRVAYDYDALGRRVRRRLEQKMEIEGLDEPVWEALRETRYVWDGLTLLHELDADGVTTWLWEGGVLVGKLTADGAFAVVTDPAGMPTEIIDAGGNLVWRGSVDVFGVVQLDIAKVDCPWRFPGHWEDPDTGLSHSLFRVYDPETAAYLSPSPLGIAGGPNLYAYLPDPVSETSPLGLGRGYATFCGELRSERLTGELVELVMTALDRKDGAAGPRARFDPNAARLTLPDPEAELWGPWEQYRPVRQIPPPTSSFTRLPDHLGLNGE